MPAGPSHIYVSSYFADCDVLVCWDNVVSNVGFELEVKIDGTSFWMVIAETDQDVLCYLDSPDPGLTYTYRVRAMYSDGSYSDWTMASPIYLICQEW